MQTCWKKKIATENSIHNKIFLQNEGKLKTFSEKEKIREFISSTHGLKCKRKFFRQKEYDMTETDVCGELKISGNC